MILRNHTVNILLRQAHSPCVTMNFVFLSFFLLVLSPSKDRSLTFSSYNLPILTIRLANNTKNEVYYKFRRLEITKLLHSKTLQSWINTKISQQRFWTCHGKVLIKRRFQRYPTTYMSSKSL